MALTEQELFAWAISPAGIAAQEAAIDMAKRVGWDIPDHHICALILAAHRAAVEA